MTIKDIILNEIKLSSKKEDYGWRYVQSNRPGEDDAYNKVHIFTFRTPKYKYIVESEEYDDDFFLVSFKPKLNKDFFVKQSNLAARGREHYDEYSYQTKENIPLQILGILVDYLKSVLKDNPKASFGYFGAPDIKTNREEDEDLFNTKRVRIYNNLLNGEFGSTHKVIHNVNFSGGLVINKDVLNDYGNDFIRYGQGILMSHL